jgi:predicted patatin/cPLA2 family phospholipase
VTVSRLERDMEKLGDLYWLGYNDALANMEEIREYLED